MKKNNFFKNLAMLVVAAVIGSCLASCSDDDFTPTITDANGDEWQVISAGGFFFTYDKDGLLTSITDRETTYSVQKDKFVVNWYDEGYLSAEFTFDDNNNITKVVSSASGYEHDNYYTSEFNLNFSYDSKERLKSYTGTSKFQTPKYLENGTATINYEWSNYQLTVRYNGTSSGYKQREDKQDKVNFNDVYNNTSIYTLGTQPNRSKQLPYCMTGNMIQIPEDDGEGFRLGRIFAVIGLFGYGPEHLPTGCTRNRNKITNGENQSSESSCVFSFIQNSNGTIMQEKDGYNGSDDKISWNDPFNYIYTPTRASATGTQSLKELLRNSLLHTQHRHMEQ